MQNVVLAFSLLIYFAGIVDVPNMYCLEVRCMHSLLKCLCTISPQNNSIHSIHRNLKETWYLQDLISLAVLLKKLIDSFIVSKHGYWVSL